MAQLLQMEDFGAITLTNMFKSIVTSVPEFFSITIFMIWIFFTASSYYVILKTTGKKRFWHSLTAMSFVSFLLALMISAMNEIDFIFLSGYWVGFYIVMTLISFYFLSQYK